MGRKIIIIGNGGTGKSTLAEQLGKRQGFPVYHLDLYTFDSTGLPVAEKDFRSRLEKMLDGEEWIIEGWSYQSTMFQRIEAADTVIYLDFPLWFCYWNALKRSIGSTFKENPYSPIRGSLWKKTADITKAMWRVHKIHEPVLRKMLKENYQGKYLYIFHTRAEMKRTIL